MSQTPTQSDDPNEIVYVSFTRHYANKRGLAFQTTSELTDELHPKAQAVQGDDWLEQELLLVLLKAEIKPGDSMIGYNFKLSDDALNKAKAAIQAQLDAAYQRGRIDEAKTCEEAKRHDTKGLYTQAQVDEAVREARIDELKGVSDHLSFGTDDRYLDPSCYTWIWQDRAPQLGIGERPEDGRLQ